MAKGPIGHLLHRGFSLTRHVLLPTVGHELMRVRRVSQIVSRWPEGPFPLGPRVCIFAHWDGAGHVHEHVLHHVRSLVDAGLSVVFVSNSGRLRPAALAAVQGLCAGVIVRRNLGYDFGGWREGLYAAGLPRADTEMVAIVNDSVYGPLRPLTELFEHVDFAEADVWGCTDTWQSRYHLQSYFMVFGRRVIDSEAWRRFWAGVRPTSTKAWLIRLYEIGLTQKLLRAGFTCRAVWPYQSLVRNIAVELLEDDREDGPNFGDPMMMARRRHVLRLREAVTGRIPLNPTSDLWRQLLVTRFPYIKRELLRHNPTHVQDVVEWRDVAAETPAAILAPIDQDLQRTLKNRAP